MNRDGSNQTQITRNEGGTPLYFLPDGHWLYYRAALQRTLRRVSLESGADELVYKNSSGNFALSPDCTRVATVERENAENVISIVALADGKTLNTLRFARPNEFLSFSIWTPDGKNLAHIMTDESDTKKSVYLLPMNGEKARKIAELSDENSFDISGLAFALDGKSFAVAQGSWNHNAVLIKGLKQSN
jgi:Tol biopolymer transport system component